MSGMNEVDRAIDALRLLSPNVPREQWIRVGMSAHAAGLTFNEFDRWSAGATNYDARADVPPFATHKTSRS